jgi:hypothetical protein
VDWRGLERKARALLADWRGLLGRNGVDARPVLSELLQGEPIQFTPIDEPEKPGYRFDGHATIGGILSGIVQVDSMVSPGGPVRLYHGRMPFEDDLRFAITA